MVRTQLARRCNLRQQLSTCGLSPDRALAPCDAKIFQPICYQPYEHLPLFYGKICFKCALSIARARNYFLIIPYAVKIIHLQPLEAHSSDMPFSYNIRALRECRTHFNIVGSAESLGPVMSDMRIQPTTLPQHFPESCARQVLNSVKLDGIAILKFQQRICKCQLSTLIVRVARGKFMHLH